ncbi:MAG: BON domain-containing protein [Massilia sp.]
MKPLVATLLATALAAAFGTATAADTKMDPATHHSNVQKAAADYKLAAAQCNKDKTGNDRAVCIEEAKVARAQAEATSADQYNDTHKVRIAAHNALVKAEYGLALVKCTVKTGAEKDSCKATAKAAEIAALDDIKAGRPVAANTGVVPPSVSTTTDATADRMANATATLTQKSENAADAAARNTRNAGAVVADKTEAAAATTGKVVADSVITTKVKADLFKEPALSAMAIHVETEKGVVMLSGFVDSKADAERAINLAKSVEGVSQVKSAIKVK